MVLGVSSVSGHMEECRSAGASGFLKWPIEVGCLVQLLRVIMAGEAIFVYPNGRVLPDFGRTAWELNAQSPDMLFFDALYERLVDELCIDEGRVFSYGHSFGGYMSNAVGCYRVE